MPKLLEVIVTSLAEAREAEAGGADRLELIRAFDQGGLTPSVSLTEQVLTAVRIPVRVMIRENGGMAIESDAEMDLLTRQIEAVSGLPIAGLVMGFTRSGEVDAVTLSRLVDVAPTTPITFHRAFEHVTHPETAIDTLKTFSSIDRILIRIGGQYPLASLVPLQLKTGPQIKIITGLGTAKHYYAELRRMESLSEVHVGRAVRQGESISGKLTAHRVSALKKDLA